MPGELGEVAVSLAKKKSPSSCKSVPVDPITSVTSVDNGGVRTVVEKGTSELKSPEAEKKNSTLCKIKQTRSS